MSQFKENQKGYQDEQSQVDGKDQILSFENGRGEIYDRESGTCRYKCKKLKGGAPGDGKVIVDNEGSVLPEVLNEVRAPAYYSEEEGLDAEDIFIRRQLHVNSVKKLYFVRVT